MSHPLMMGLALISLAACTGSDGNDTSTDETDTGDTDTTSVDGAVSNLTIVLNTTVPGVARATFDTDVEGDAVVLFGTPGEMQHRAPVSTGTSHDVLLLGAPSGAPLAVQVEFTVSGATELSNVVEETVPVLQGGLPNFSLDEWNPELACDEQSFVLFSYLGQSASGVGILNRAGDYVWSMPNDVANTLVARARPGRDGDSLLWNLADEDRIDDVATVRRLSLEGGMLSETRTLNGHHDFIELPEGGFGWLGYDFRDTDIDLQTFPVAVDTLHEDAEGVSDETNTLTLFNMFDDYPWDIWYVGDDMNQGVFLPGYNEFSHGNSLMYRESDDSYFMMFRWLDALVKVDRATGAFEWQMGGRDNEFTSTGGDADFFNHAHMSEIWDGGMLVFDNQDPAVMPSRLVEYTIDEPNRTITKVWEYNSDRNEALLGDVRRVPIDGCDNIIVSWSAQARIAELTRDGETVWEVSGGIGQVTSRVHYIADLYALEDAVR